MIDDDRTPESAETSRAEGQPTASPDWRETFRPQARFTRTRHKLFNFCGILLAVGGFMGIAFSAPDAWYWGLAFATGVMLVLGVLSPRPWPDCPACGRGFSRFGAYCPACGRKFDHAATAKRAFCSACGFVMHIWDWIYYWSKAPVRKIRLARRQGRGKRHRYEIIPVRYCMHCRARLND